MFFFLEPHPITITPPSHWQLLLSVCRSDLHQFFSDHFPSNCLRRRTELGKKVSKTIYMTIEKMCVFCHIIKIKRGTYQYAFLSKQRHTWIEHLFWWRCRCRGRNDKRMNKRRRWKELYTLNNNENDNDSGGCSRYNSWKGSDLHLLMSHRNCWWEQYNVFRSGQPNKCVYTVQCTIKWFNVVAYSTTEMRVGGFSVLAFVCDGGGEFVAWTLRHLAVPFVLFFSVKLLTVFSYFCRVVILWSGSKNSKKYQNKNFPQLKVKNC